MPEKIALVVDLGGTNIRVAAVTEKGMIVEKVQEKTDHQGDPSGAVTEQIIRLLQEVKKLSKDFEILGIAIGVPGKYDQERGGITAGNVSQSFVPIAEPIAQALELPVLIQNDASLATLGEQYFGAGKGVDNFVYITISTGIGAGVVIDGKLIADDDHLRELGHQSVGSDYVFTCSCDLENDHWEALASGKNIPRFFAGWGKRNGYEKIKVFTESTRQLFEKVKLGDKVALEFMKELGKVNAAGIANAIKAYHPQRIILGGAAGINHGQIMIKYLLPYLEKNSALPEILVSSLGGDNALLGGLVLVFQKKGLVV